METITVVNVFTLQTSVMRLLGYLQLYGWIFVGGVLNFQRVLAVNARHSTNQSDQCGHTWRERKRFCHWCFKHVNMKKIVFKSCIGNTLFWLWTKQPARCTCTTSSSASLTPAHHTQFQQVSPDVDVEYAHQQEVKMETLQGRPADGGQQRPVQKEAKSTAEPIGRLLGEPPRPQAAEQETEVQAQQRSRQVHVQANGSVRLPLAKWDRRYCEHSSWAQWFPGISKT